MMNYTVMGESSRMESQYDEALEAVADYVDREVDAGREPNSEVLRKILLDFKKKDGQLCRNRNE